MCFSPAVSEAPFQVSDPVGDAPHGQSEFQRAVSVLKASSARRCGHWVLQGAVRAGIEPAVSWYEPRRFSQKLSIHCCWHLYGIEQGTVLRVGLEPTSSD